jgi:hypothetical protein
MLCALPLLPLVGCGDDDDAPPPPADAGPADAGPVDAGPPPYRDECENLNPLGCMLPWPSSRYLTDDTTTDTGRRVAIPVEAMPKNDADTPIPVDPAELNRWDGFTGQTSFMTLYAGRIDDSRLADWLRVERSVAADSETILFDATTMERLPHFAELDKQAGISAELRPFYIRPARRMPENHHIIIATRNLRLMDGSPVQPHEGFRALRDNTPTTVPGIESRRRYFESEVFAPLTAAGIDRSTLVEAWDIWTGTDESAWGDAVKMRDDALRRIGERGLGCTVTDIRDDVNEQIFRQVEGTVTVPLYQLENAAGSPLRRDSSGAPLAMGTFEFPFTVLIPRSVKTRIEAGGDPVRVMQYGHGLFGGRGEAEGSYVRNFANDYPTVIVAGDWNGMAGPDDVEFATRALANISLFPTFVDRQVQGFINLLVMVRTLKGVCTEDPAFQIAGRLAYDPTQVYYHGNSQGGIFGGSLAGLSTDITHFALGVGAVSYAVFMPRSTNWKAYELILKQWYPNKIDRALLLVQLGQSWERSDPAVYSAHTLSDVLPNSPTNKRILYQTGRWDAQVANNGADIAARNFGIPVHSPSIYPVFGLDSFTNSAPSGYVVYETGASPVPDDFRYATEEPRDSVIGSTVHETVRRDPRAQMQLDAFMRPDGVVQNFCDGACDSM